MADLTELFTKKLPEKLAAADADVAAGVAGIYVFDLDGFGKWTVEVGAETRSVSEGAHESPDCTVSASAEDFSSALDQPSKFMTLFTQGRLKVSSLAHAMKLPKLLQ
jgi:putative sterol carrier protein